jgi:hypothetical protein
MMEEIISMDDEENTHIDIEDNNKFNSSSSLVTNGDIVNKKSTDKMSHIILLSAPWYAKVKSSTKIEYYDVCVGEDFFGEWLK